ncbi:hypothetical protein B0H13DRAFT_1608444, partial [Mycena leptocephala]
SSNQHPFLAIVAHYVTNDGKLEEMLIDFREMVGEHSGENMAEEVWNCIEMYGLEEKVDRDDDTYDMPELVPI